MCGRTLMTCLKCIVQLCIETTKIRCIIEHCANRVCCRHSPYTHTILASCILIFLLLAWCTLGSSKPCLHDVQCKIVDPSCRDGFCSRWVIICNRGTLVAKLHGLCMWHCTVCLELCLWNICYSFSLGIFDLLGFRILVLTLKIDIQKQSCAKSTL